MKAKKKFEKTDVYQLITDKIIEKLEQGVVPWQRPWKMTCGGESVQRNFVSKKSYNGFNVMMLEMQGFQCPWWVSFKQAKDLGGNIRKGEHGTPVIFWKRILVSEKNEETGEDEKKTIPMLKHMVVFNLEQCEGIDIPSDEEEVVDGPVFNPIEKAEMIVEGYKAKPRIGSGGNRAFYSPNHDMIQMPDRVDFHSEAEFYSTLFHEMIHSTGHQKRLNREGVANFDRFGSHQYSKEELIAELGNCFLCSHAGIERTFDNSVAYIQSWLKQLSNDKKLVVSASTKAVQATKHILGIEEDHQEEE